MYRNRTMSFKWMTLVTVRSEVLNWEQFCPSAHWASLEDPGGYQNCGEVTCSGWSPGTPLNILQGTEQPLPARNPGQNVSRTEVEKLFHPR